MTATFARRSPDVQLALTWLVVVVVAATSAHAESVTERATRLFNEARELKQRGKPGACERFAESYQLVAGAGTGFNLAECMEEAGELVGALELFERIAKQYADNGRLEAAEQARRRAASVRARVGELVIEVAHPVDGVVLVVGGARVTAAATLRQLVNPGQIQVAATAPGRRSFMATVTARAGRPSIVRVELPPLTSSTMRRRRSRVTLAAGLGVVGAGAIVSGAVLFAQARSLDSEGRRDAALARADLATGVGIAGIVAAAAAGVVFWTAPRELVLVPIATVDTGGIALTGRF